MFESDQKVLVVAHDAGSSEIISSWCRRNQHHDYRFILGGPALKIFSSKIFNFSILDLDALEQWIRWADFVITGTSWGHDMEYQTIFTAKCLEKKVITYLDHWSNYSIRFNWKGTDHYPDEIWVFDEQAYQLAITHFPSTLIHLKPNPYFQDLKEEIARSQSILPSNSDGNLLYICDSFKYCPYALQYFLTCVPDIIFPKPVKSIRIRPHPYDSLSQIKVIMQNFPNMPVHLSTEHSLLEDCLWANLIVGVKSMGLVVGLLAGKKVYSCTPPGNEKSTLPHQAIQELKQKKKLSDHKPFILKTVHSYPG